MERIFSAIASFILSAVAVVSQVFFPVAEAPAIHSPETKIPTSLVEPAPSRAFPENLFTENKASSTEEKEASSLAAPEDHSAASPLREPPSSSPAVRIETPSPASSELSGPLVHLPEDSGAEGALSSGEIVRLTNEYRRSNSLSLLSRNALLDASAIIKVHDMFNGQYFEHVSPSGRTPSELVESVGYHYLWTGENLALGVFESERELVDAWMESPGHRENILKPQFTEIGVGVDEGVFEGKRVWLAVQEFGKPASDCSSPDDSLLAELAANKATIDERSRAATELLNAIRSLEPAAPADVSSYNAKVNEYNALATEVNGLISRAKEIVALYNEEVKTYNLCIETPK